MSKMNAWITFNRFSDENAWNRVEELKSNVMKDDQNWRLTKFFTYSLNIQK